MKEAERDKWDWETTPYRPGWIMRAYKQARKVRHAEAMELLRQAQEWEAGKDREQSTDD